MRKNSQSILKESKIKQNINSKNKFQCVICNKQTLQCCQSCQKVFYCSAEHQQLHWPNHKLQCKQKQKLNISINSNEQFSPVNEDSEEIQDILNVEEDEKKDDFQIQQQISELNKQRLKLRSIIFQLISEKQFEKANMATKKLLNITEKTSQLQVDMSYETKQKEEFKQIKMNNFYENTADKMLFIRTYLLMGRYKIARQQLQELFLLIPTQFNTLNSYSELDKSLQEVFYKYPTRLKEYMQNIRRQSDIYSTISNYFYQLGDMKNCEKCYGLYCKMIEHFYGQFSLESSNVYFLIGVFYLQHKYFMKALSCFKTAVKIRISLLGETHQSIADCWYNISLVYKGLNKFQKSKMYIEKCLEQRKILDGKESQSVSQCLEILGKIGLLEEDYKTSLEQFTQSYNIRKKLNSNKEDLERISLLILHLNNIIEIQLKQDDNTRLQTNILENVQEELNEKVLDKNLKSFQDFKQQELQHLKNEIIEQKAQAKREEQEILSKQKESLTNQNNLKKKKKSNYIFNIDINLMQELSLKQLELLSQLNEEIRSKQEENEYQFNLKDYIYASEFIESINSPQIYFQIRKLNPTLFEEQDFYEIQPIFKEIREQFLQNQKSINETTQMQDKDQESDNNPSYSQNYQSNNDNNTNQNLQLNNKSNSPQTPDSINYDKIDNNQKLHINLEQSQHQEAQNQQETQNQYLQTQNQYQINNNQIKNQKKEDNQKSLLDKLNQEDSIIQNHNLFLNQNTEEKKSSFIMSENDLIIKNNKEIINMRKNLETPSFDTQFSQNDPNIFFNQQNIFNMSPILKPQQRSNQNLIENRQQSQSSSQNYGEIDDFQLQTKKRLSNNVDNFQQRSKLIQLEKVEISNSQQQINFQIEEGSIDWPLLDTQEEIESNQFFQNNNNINQIRRKKSSLSCFNIDNKIDINQVQLSKEQTINENKQEFTNNLETIEDINQEQKDTSQQSIKQEQKDAIQCSDNQNINTNQFLKQEEKIQKQAIENIQNQQNEIEQEKLKNQSLSQNLKTDQQQINQQNQILTQPSLINQVVQLSPSSNQNNQEPPEKSLIMKPQINQIIQPPNTNKVLQPPPINQVIQPPPINQVIQPPSINQVIQQPPPINQVIQQPPPINKVIQQSSANQIIQPPSINTILNKPSSNILQPPPINLLNKDNNDLQQNKTQLTPLSSVGQNLSNQNSSQIPPPPIMGPPKLSNLNLNKQEGPPSLSNLNLNIKQQNQTKQIHWDKIDNNQKTIFDEKIQLNDPLNDSELDSPINIEFNDLQERFHKNPNNSPVKPKANLQNQQNQIFSHLQNKQINQKNKQIQNQMIDLIQDTNKHRNLSLFIKSFKKTIPLEDLQQSITLMDKQKITPDVCSLLQQHSLNHEIKKKIKQFSGDISKLDEPSYTH